MLKTSYSPAFMVALGDNFYEHGIKSTKDSRWQSVFENAYSAPMFQKKGYAIVGNHDWRAGVTGVQAQVDYTHISPNGRWYMPFTYYQKMVPVDGQTQAHLIFLDTTKILDGDPPQLKWLRDVLSKSTAQWVIVFGHHPVISASDHGNIPEMLERVYPLLNEYNVDLYIAGHDHVMEHLKDGNVNYYVCGSGCKLGTMQTRPAQLLYGEAKLGFCGFEIGRDISRIKIITDDGTVVDDTEIQRRRRP